MQGTGLYGSGDVRWLGPPAVPRPAGHHRSNANGFRDGTTDAFNPRNFKFEGQLTGSDGKPIVIQDLWSLVPGNNGAAGSSNTLFFTAGLQNEQHGLFGCL